MTQHFDPTLHTRTAFGDRALDVLLRVDLPFGWTFRLSERGDRRTPDVPPVYYLQVTDPNPTCNVTGETIGEPWRSRKWLLSEHMTDGEIVQTLFKATMTAVEHEVRELFLYRGQAVFDPHYDIEKLVELRAQPDALKERDPG